MKRNPKEVLALIAAIRTMLDANDPAGVNAARQLGKDAVDALGGDEYERVFLEVNEALGKVKGVNPLVVAMCLGGQAKDPEDVWLFAGLIAAHYRANLEAGN